jgi:hypothetical protein
MAACTGRIGRRNSVRRQWKVAILRAEHSTTICYPPFLPGRPQRSVGGGQTCECWGSSYSKLRRTTFCQCHAWLSSDSRLAERRRRGIRRFKCAAQRSANPCELPEQRWHGHDPRQRYRTQSDGQWARRCAVPHRVGWPYFDREVGHVSGDARQPIYDVLQWPEWQ